MAKKRSSASGHPYKRPYLDSSVFIGWIKGEQIKATDTGQVVDRGKIGTHILTQAEDGQFPIVISSLTIAEVHKKKHKPKLTDDENRNTLSYFHHGFVTVQPIDREIGEEANRLCRKHQDKKLLPADALHVACAKRAGCDVLLAWDGPLTEITEDGLRIEHPRVLGQGGLWAVESEA